MTSRKKWLVGGAATLAVVAGGLYIAASVLAGRVEPYIREQALAYVRARFDGEVEMGRLQVHVPAGLPLKLMFHSRGTMARVEGSDLLLRHKGRRDVPPLFQMKKFTFEVDPGTVFDTPKSVQSMTLEGMEIHLPPKGERPDTGTAQPGATGGVVIKEVLVRDARLVILPRDSSRLPLDFAIQEVRLTDAGKDVAMNYTAALTNPRPPGQIHSTGTFGPWAAGEPGETPLGGEYLLEDAGLGVFKSIAGKLRSTGKFSGTLSSITARGDATIPEFRLTGAGNPVPLTAIFEVLVDGTNGNTTLKPVLATLGSTKFTTTGFVVKHIGDKQRTIFIDAKMPVGNLRDVLRLGMKGTPMMAGTIRLNTTIGIPPLAEKVKEKITLDGTFEVTNGKFLRSAIQGKIDGLSHRSQGKKKGEEVEAAVHRMSGAFKMADERITFQTLAFSIPGAAVNLGGHQSRRGGRKGCSGQGTGGAEAVAPDSV